MNVSNITSEILTKLKLPVLNFSASEIERKYRSLLILIAITAVTYTMAGLFYSFVGMKLTAKGVAKPVQERAVVVASLQRQPADYYAVIPQRNLFGTTEKKDTADEAKAPPPTVPDISLLLALRGTVAGTGKDGFAVIEEKGKGGKQLLYKVGNVVAGAKLFLIERNSVTFQIGETEKILKMTERPEAPAAPPRATAVQPLPPLASARSEPMTISRSDVTASLRDIGTMMSQAQIRPFYSGGVPDGFIITNIRPGSVFEKIGLTNGDIIQGADDRRLVTADDWMSLYNSMKSGTMLNLRIKRSGAETNLNYVFR